MRIYLQKKVVTVFNPLINNRKTTKSFSKIAAHNLDTTEENKNNYNNLMK